MFQLYLEQGFRHITDIHAYDHIAFIIALLIGYTFKDWKTILGLVTAFTIGHSITLALSTFKLVHFPSEWIEFLIPATIFITTVLHLIYSDKNKGFKGKYLLALFFGLIHGAGFSNYLQSILGTHVSFFNQLFAFNLGVEIGQIVIVLIILSIGFIAVKLFKIPNKIWTSFLVILSLSVSIFLMIKTWPITL